MSVTVRDSKGHDWHPVFDGEAVFSWARANGLTINQLINAQAELPVSCIVDALWWTCRFEVQSEFPKMGKQEFLQRFSMADTMAAIPKLLESLAEGLPEPEAVAPEASGDVPLEVIQES